MLEGRRGGRWGAAGAREERGGHGGTRKTQRRARAGRANEGPPAPESRLLTRRYSGTRAAMASIALIEPSVTVTAALAAVASKVTGHASVLRRELRQAA